MSKKKNFLTPEEREKIYAEERKRMAKFMNDDYNNPQSETRAIIEALKKM